MAKAAEQAPRDEDICAAHAGGAAVADLMKKHKLSKSRINQIVAAGGQLLKRSSSGLQLAEERLTSYRELYAEIRIFTAAIPATQPAAKVGAYRLIFDVLGRQTSLEQKLGYLPGDLADLGHMREFAGTIFRILEEHDAPPRITEALVAELENDRWQA